MKTIKYGLFSKETKKLVGYVSQHNEPGDNVSNSYSLDLYSDDKWLVDTPEHAEYVRLNSTEWYNADIETPENNIDPETLDVVKVEIETNYEKVNVKIPTFKELMEYEYKNDNPSHYHYILEELNKNPEMKYSLYELNDYLKERYENNQ
jgi:hypothetical protein